MTSEGASLTPPRANLTRLGPYELLRPIAQGGMADIYLARKPGLGGEIERYVAVKVLNAQRALEPESCAMFLDEARLVAMLNHQNIAAILEVDVVDGMHYLAMEHVHGADLREMLHTAARAERIVPFETSLSIVIAAAAGLDHAHRRCGRDGKPLRLVHRDVSLSNIMVGHDGSVKVIDFGIAQTTLKSVHTVPGVVRGKASYMSPEQCLGETVDHRTDVFALGIVLYELTTGARCFHGKSDFERMLAVVRSDYLAPSDLVDGYPAELEQVVKTALAPDPARRYASAAALIEALERVMVCYGWVGGTGAIARLMHDVFGSVRAPWAAEDAAAGPGEPGPTVVECPALQLPVMPMMPTTRTTPLTAPRRFPRGTMPEMYEELRAADARAFAASSDDEVTRGRRPLRRPTRPGVAA